MDHAEARELLELAAVEPGGLDRLVAGDTPTAIALAGHLAGCDTCMDEFARLRQSSQVVRGVIATMPPPELRERTLAFVAALGRPRGAAPHHVTAETPAADAAAGPGVGISARLPALPVTAIQSPAPPASALAHRSRRPRLAWLAAAAALVIATAGVTGSIVSSAAATSTRQTSRELEGLTEVASWTIRLDAQPDVRHVLLSAGPPNGTREQQGMLVFSPKALEVVVVADGMPDPPANMEYRCWVEIGGTRQRLGKMYLSGSLAYWVGDASVLASVPDGSMFGVSLVDITGSGGGSPVILSGTLQAT